MGHQILVEEQSTDSNRAAHQDVASRARAMTLIVAFTVICSQTSGEELASGPTRCEGSFVRAMSAKLDEYSVAVRHTATLGLPAEANLDPVDHILETSHSIRDEWMNIKARVSSSYPSLATRIDERVSFFRFFTFMLFLTKDSGGSWSLKHLESYGVETEMIVRTYAAIPPSYLRHVESSISSPEVPPFRFSEPPFDLKNFTENFYSHRGSAAMAEMARTVERELRSELDGLCKRIRNGESS